jgi:hypothetical protein
MADTASNVQFKVENGLLVVGSANFQNTSTVNGAFTVNNTAALGNTTITGFTNVSSALAAGNTTVTGFLIASGSGSFGTTLSAGNTTVNGSVVLQGTSKSFNASSNVNSATDTFTINAHGFSNGDLVKYLVASGNTVISGLTNNNNYYLISVTSNTFQISATYGGSNINVTAGANQTGHSFTPLRIVLDDTIGSISSSIGLANVASIRSLGNVTVNGSLTVSNVASLGNTTITGFANISSALNVVGAATVNGALTVNNTAAIGNTTITGFANVSTTLNVEGALTVNNTGALGNTTITGFANISSTLAAGDTTITGFANVSSTLAAGNTTITGFANISSTLAAGNTTITGFANISSTLAAGDTTINGFANISSTLQVAANAAFDNDLLFLDAVNNRIGMKNAAPSDAGLLTIAGNIVFTAANTTGLRFFTSNASHNAAVTLVGTTTNTRLTFSTFDSSNSSVKNGGFIFYGVNSSASQALLSFSNSEFLYKTGNVTHAGIFGIYDVNGTRVGP